MTQRILCVAEKNSIAKAVAQHLGGGAVRTSSIDGIDYVKNYQFSCNFREWGHCSVTMTSVSGHLTGVDFPDELRRWDMTTTQLLFDANTQTKVDPKNQPIANNIQVQARRCTVLFIWTDCDREGEHIGSEIRAQALSANSRMTVKRARFNNTERAHIIQAAQNPIVLDERQIAAVSARRELDLRIGATFTRLLTLSLTPLGDLLDQMIISYGSCQFPTLGFVVERYFRVKNFKPETFWSIKVIYVRDDVKVNFLWRRSHLFDRAIVTIIFERCLDARLARVTQVRKKPTSKWRPLPLTTVELQMQGSRFLRMDSKKVMHVAEQLYSKGWISYPRTETDQFAPEFDLRALVGKQTQHANWGIYAQGLVDGGFRAPRQGRNNDQAHPPIHPVNYVAPTALESDDERRVYEFVTRRFLACCSEDAKGEATDIDIEWGGEIFSTHGLLVLARNYLDVYVYDKWESSQQLPVFQPHESFEPTEARMSEGKTTAPSYLTEPELIGLMDANGIGTDATMADHVAMIKDRSYVAEKPRSGGRNAVVELIPTRLGVALVEGYDNVGLQVSVSKPFLRKEMELRMKAICEGRLTRRDAMHESVEQYRDVFVLTQRNIGALRRSVRKYVFNDDS